MKALMKRFAQDDSGLTAIEYGLIGGFIAIAVAAFMPQFTTALTTLFGGLNTTLGNATPGA
ncbi:MAG: Flp family type IVb pilin [Pseudomonadota bacterium]